MGLRHILAGIVLLTAALAGSASAATYQVISTFQGGQDGGSPQSPLTLYKNTLFGTTNSGGGSNAGTVFAIDTKTGTRTAIYKFCTLIISGHCEGQWPGTQELLIDKDGTIYGTTPAPGLGIVFRLKPPVTPGGNWAFSTLHSFTGGADGGAPLGGLIMDGAGVLYGTTSRGGPGGVNVFTGTVFSIDTRNANHFETIHAFTGGAGGAGPAFTLTFGKTKNSFYGTTSSGGVGGPCPAGECTLFKIDKKKVKGVTTFIFATQYTFPFGRPVGTLVRHKSGLLYGTTDVTGGKIFAFNPDTQVLTDLYAFCQQPVAPACSTGMTPGFLRLDSTGMLYGTTAAGGTSNNGTAFIFNPAAPALTTLHNFSVAGGDGFSPRGGMLRKGAYYFGTTAGGGGAQGTAFKLKS